MQVGLLVSSPIFAEASKHVNAFRLIALGLGVWTLSTAGCGISVGDAQIYLILEGFPQERHWYRD